MFPIDLIGYESFFIFLLPIIILEVVLKGIALWKASKNEHLGWFIAIFILNTAGILPLIYILIHRKNK